MRDAIALGVKDRPQKIDILHWTTRTALEFIGQSGLGIRRIDECFHSSHSCPFLQVTVLRNLMTAQLMNIA